MRRYHMPCWFLLVLASLAVADTLPKPQTDFLKELYDATNGDQWINNYNWTIGDPCDNHWYGVRCTLSPQLVMNVHELALPENNLNGTIPESVSDLTAMEFLYVQGNLLSGSLPRSLYSMSRLQKVLLGINDFSGSISPAIANMTSLGFLDLSLNHLSGTIPEELYTMTRLTNLYLNNNRQPVAPGEFRDGLSGTVSANISNLASLRVLQLNMNQLIGELPTELFLLTNMRDLFLGGNDFEGTFPEEIGSMQKLQQLELSVTLISGTIPEVLFDLTDLYYLNIGLNRMSGTISSKLAQLTNLRQLYLNSSPDPKVKQHFEGALPTAVFDLHELQYLYLSDNGFTGSFPDNDDLDRTWRNLTLLDIGDNALNGTLPRSLFDIRTLETLYVDSNAFTGTIPAPGHTNLTRVKFNDNQFSGNISSEYQRFAASGEQDIFRRNPFLCPLPSWAEKSPFKATCQEWILESVQPDYADIRGGTQVTLLGDKFAVGLESTPSLRCMFSWPSLYPLRDANITIPVCEYPAPPPMFNHTGGGCFNGTHNHTGGCFNVTRNHTGGGWFNGTGNMTSNQSSNGNGSEPLVSQWHRATTTLRPLRPLDIPFPPPLQQPNGTDFPIPPWLNVVNGTYCVNSTDEIPRAFAMGEVVSIPDKHVLICEAPEFLVPTSSPSGGESEFRVTVSYDNASVAEPHIPFTYITTPTVTSFEPNNGRQQGDNITVIGKDFGNIPELRCMFGKHAVDATWFNTTYLECESPATNDPTTVDFKVLNGDLESKEKLTYEYWPWCDGPYDTPCSGNGNCDNTTLQGEAVCRCNKHFTGRNCEACDPLYYGSKCEECRDCGDYGECDDGIDGSGKCKCRWYYVGATCEIPWLWITLIALGVVLAIALLVGVAFIGKNYLQKMKQQRMRRALVNVGDADEESALLEDPGMID